MIEWSASWQIDGRSAIDGRFRFSLRWFSFVRCASFSGGEQFLPGLRIPPKLANFAETRLLPAKRAEGFLPTPKKADLLIKIYAQFAGENASVMHKRDTPERKKNREREGRRERLHWSVNAGESVH